MKTIQLLNIPNYYVSYYLLGLNQVHTLEFKMDRNFIKFNNKPILIFKIDNKIVVIDNDDPTGVNQELYDISTVYFVTNKHVNQASYKQPKVKPLYPHYPVNIVSLYIRVFGFGLFRYLKFKEMIQQFYILLRRPKYIKYKNSFKKDNFVFFSSNIWKKEQETNEIRAQFIRFCKAESRITFKGGFIPRSDGFNFGFDKELNDEKYTPKMFSRLSAKSKVVLNNPAVCGAVSWRFAEYLNQGLFVISFPFKIELPNTLDESSVVYFIEETKEFNKVLDLVIENPNFHESIAQKGKLYFDTYCTPVAQAHYIYNSVFN